MKRVIVNKWLGTSSRKRQLNISNYNYSVCRLVYQEDSIFEPPILGLLFRVCPQLRQAPVLDESLGPFSLGFRSVGRCRSPTVTDATV